MIFDNEMGFDNKMLTSLAKVAIPLFLYLMRLLYMPLGSDSIIRDSVLYHLRLKSMQIDITDGSI